MFRALRCRHSTRPTLSQGQLRTRQSWFGTMSKQQTDGSKVLEREPLKGTNFKWTTLKKIHWKDRTGRERIWESAERATTPKSGIDAIGVVALIKNTETGQTEMLCQKQYRPPIESLCIEVPAGLVDEGETPEQTAERELYEETGYKGKAVESSSLMYNDPGFTNSSMKLIFVHVDVSLPENQNPTPHLDEGEHIDNFKLPVKGLYEKLKELEDEGYKVDGRLAAVAAGLKISGMIS